MLRTTALALALAGAAAAPAIAQETTAPTQAPAQGIVSSQLGLELTPFLVVAGVGSATFVFTQIANENDSSGTN